VKPYRAKARSGDRTGVRWWIHQRPRPAMREALGSLDRFAVTPTVSKHRLFKWCDQPTLPDHQLIVFARDDDYFFGVLHSRSHELWALRKGSQLESRPTYTPTTTFETFPFPRPTNEQESAIAEAARTLNEMRENWLNPPPRSIPDIELKKRTLTNLYNARPAWLDILHRKLDETVFDAYAWPHDISDEQILERLLALNLEREQA